MLGSNGAAGTGNDNISGSRGRRPIKRKRTSNYSSLPTSGEDSDNDEDIMQQQPHDANPHRTAAKRARIMPSHAPRASHSAALPPPLPPPSFAFYPPSSSGFQAPPTPPLMSPMLDLDCNAAPANPYASTNQTLRAARLAAEYRAAASQLSAEQAAHRRYAGINAELRRVRREACIARGLPIPDDDIDDGGNEDDN
ncbi:hypothetical protein BC828DRAFT_439279 [Blastocladiella britannica]|nr:hypothetical protein BC828DRAFT_439279 [Blastocladiella britannica]